MSKSVTLSEAESTSWYADEAFRKNAIAEIQKHADKSRVTHELFDHKGRACTWSGPFSN